MSLWVNGEPVGFGYKGLQGGGALIGRIENKTISDPQVLFLNFSFSISHLIVTFQAVILMPGHRYQQCNELMLFCFMDMLQ